MSKIKNFIADIIIPHHDRIDLLENCLSFIDQRKFNVIVESGGTFAQNCNRGAKKALTEKLIFLNDDVEIENSLLLEMCDKKSDIVGISQTIEHFPGVIFGLGMNFSREKLSISFSMNREELFFPSGFCFLIKKKCWEQLNGLDEVYQNGHEDVDLFMRAIEAKASFAFIDRPARHLHSQSAGRHDNHDRNTNLFWERWNELRIENLLRENKDRLVVDRGFFKWKNFERGLDESDFSQKFREFYLDKETAEIEFSDNIDLENELVQRNSFCVNFKDAKFTQLFKKLSLEKKFNEGVQVFLLMGDYGKFFKINPNLDQSYLDHYSNFSLWFAKKELLTASFISHSAGRYGAEKSLSNLLQEITQRGVLAQVIIPENGPIEEELLDLPIALEICETPWSTKQKDLVRVSILRKLVMEKAIESGRKIARFGADLVFSNTSVIDGGAWAAKMLNLPHIWRVLEYGRKEHSIDFIDTIENRIKFINQYSDKIIFSSEGLQNFYGKEIGFDKLAVVPEIFDLEEKGDESFTQLKTYFKNKKALKILVIGNLAEGKRQEEAVLAVSDLVKQGKEVELFLAGGHEDESYLTKIKELIAVNDLAKNVTLGGYCSEIRQLMQQADVVLSCSILEGFGRTLVEAMLQRKAVIGAASGGVKELIQEGQNGFLYKPGDYRELAEKLNYLIENSQEIALLGEKGYAFARERFQTKVTAEKAVNLLKEVKSQSKLTGPNQVTVDFLDDFSQETENSLAVLLEKERQLVDQISKNQIITNSKFWKMRNFYLKLKHWLTFVFLNPRKFFKKSIRLLKKAFNIFKEKGWRGFWKELKIFLAKNGILKPKAVITCKDFLIVSGCYLEMPQKYRCDFQKEQLEKHGLKGDFQFFTAINDAWLKYYDVFIFYRTPITPAVESFIKQAKKLNKLVIFDIDDLVFDENLVKGKHEFKAMNAEEKKIYLDGIRRHRKTMQLCDFGIASTETIAEHMRKIIPTVLINRNSVPDALLERSKKAYISRTGEDVVLGYFSGSKTHDDDLKLIENVLIETFDKYPKVKLTLVGPLTLSDKLKAYEDRIIRHDFVSFEKLPDLIAQIDINLLPLAPTEFNHGKSEIKYTEAALVKRPTIASVTKTNAYAIKDGQTGFLAENESQWQEKLFQLIENKSLRMKLANQAYQDVIKHYNTFKIGQGLVDFINENRRKKIVYVSPSVKISGGVMVVGQHLKMLQAEGFNVSLVACDNEERLDWIDDFSVPIIPINSFEKAELKLLDIAVATLWSTLISVQRSTARKKYYFVQNKEHFFYSKEDSNFALAKATYYARNVEFITMSRWCQGWLKDEFNQDARYIPNGISVDNFHKTKPLKPKGRKTRILIEGNPDDNYKNVDEAFEIVKKLDRNSFEVWLISYGGEPKKWYSYDQSFNKIPYKEMKKYYSSCDILLKTSRLESFSYPPLEMMACGGVCVVAENGGNAEYIKAEFNALTYQLGDIETAVRQIERLRSDEELKEKLKINGMKTVKERAWINTLKELKRIYNNGEN